MAETRIEEMVEPVACCLFGWMKQMEPDHRAWDDLSARERQPWIDATDAVLNASELLEGRAAEVSSAIEGTMLRDALKAIRGPTDSGPWIEAYRAAGGGYEGLQAIAKAALGETCRT